MEQKVGYRNRVLLCCHLGQAAIRSALPAGFIATSASNTELPLYGSMLYLSKKMGTLHVYRNDHYKHKIVNLFIISHLIHKSLVRIHKLH